VRLTTQISCRRQKMRELNLHYPSMPSWRGAKLQQRDSFTFKFAFTFMDF